MSIDLKSLVRAAPFDDKTRQEILSKFDKLSDDQKFKIQETCWAGLANQYQNRLAHEMNRMILEMAQRKGLYSQKDFTEMQTKLYHDFAEKLRAAGTEEELTEVREKLKEHMPQKAKVPNSLPDSLQDAAVSKRTGK